MIPTPSKNHVPERIFMDKHEWEILDKLLCAAYDCKPMTIHKSASGKITGVDVHEDGEDNG